MTPRGEPVLPQGQQQQAQVPLQQQPQQAPADQAALLSLDVLSPAFSLQRGQQQGGAQAEQLAQRCASKLGMRPERLRYYALMEVVGPDDLPQGCSRAAVEVLGSTFSLSALEELMAENQQLKDAAMATAADAQKQQQRGQQDTEVAQLQARLQQLQLENGALRQQLRQSESLRRKGKKALHELKQEFDALSRALLLEHASGLALGKQLAAPPSMRRGPEGTPAAVSDALQL